MRDPWISPFRLRNLWEEHRDSFWWLSPSVFLALCLFSLHFALLSASLVFYKLPFYAYLPVGLLQVFVVFMSFTILHDGVHSSLSKHKFLNEFLLIACWPIFLNNPLFFRKVHFQHHAKVNRGGEDPDHFTSSKSLSLSFVKSFFLIFYYHWFALKKFRDLRSLGHILASLAAPILLFQLALVTPFTWPILIVWILPAFIAVGFLAFLNTALPHHPGRATDRFRNTRVSFVPWWLQFLMLNQNLHLVHHLRPSMPWYEYPDYWRQHERLIQARGGKVLKLSRRAEPYALIPQAWIEQFQRFQQILSFYFYR